MRTTKKQFHLFVSQCKKWIEILGLKDWDVGFRHTDLPDGSAGMCSWQLEPRIAYIDFALNIDDGYMFDDKIIKRYAFHEVCHLFLAKIHSLSEARFIGSEDVDSEIHAVIRTMENVILN